MAAMQPPSSTPVSFGWDDEAHTTILVRVDGKWSLDTHDQVIRGIQDLKRDLPYDVHIIVQVTRSAGPPPSGAMQRWQALLNARDDNVDYVVMVAENIMARVFATLVLSVVPRKAGSRLVVVASLPAAREKLALLTHKQQTAAQQR